MIDAMLRWLLRRPLVAVLGVVVLLAAGHRALYGVPIDAIPDIGEKQVIVYADWPGRSPQDVDDQVTFPLTTTLTGTPGVKAIRSMSGFGFAMAFVIFEDDVDYYWARSRVLERLGSTAGRLPPGVTPALGPDATALGQIYWYTLEGEGFDLAELRSIQDWYVRWQLAAVPGVSEVASVGGFVKQYQIDVDPDRLRAHGVTLPQVWEAVRRSNLDVGAKVVEDNGVEAFVRGVGFVKSAADLEKIVVREVDGVPLFVENVATVTLGPDFRRGALDRAGEEAVGGVVVMRFGENPLRVLAEVEAKLARIEHGMPEKTLADGRRARVKIVPFYDRGGIVRETIATLTEALIEETLVAAAIVLLFLLHVRAAIAPILTLPLGIAGCFVLMDAFGIDANVMSLAGLAIAIGDVADMGIIMTENVYRHVVAAGGRRRHAEVVWEGAREVAAPILVAVSNTLVSFLPVFFLEGQEAKLFRPLAFTKTFAIGASVVLAVTVVPVACLFLLRPTAWSRRRRSLVAALVGIGAVAVFRAIATLEGVGGGSLGWPLSLAAGLLAAAAAFRAGGEGFVPLEGNPVSRAITSVYAPMLRWTLDHKPTFMLLPVTMLVLGLSVWLGIGTVLRPLQWAIEGLAGAGAVDFAALRMQTVRDAGGALATRMAWHEPGADDLAEDAAAGIEVVHEVRILPGLGREFMPPLDEGSLLYMPSLLPHAGLSEAVEVNRRQDLAIASVPEVASVVGKLGRADSALDPAPISMMETVIVLDPVDTWRKVEVERWFSGLPGWIRSPLSLLWPEERRITKAELVDELARKTAIPGVLPTFLQPIQTRIVMLQTGFRAMMGVKIYGADLGEIERIGLGIERILATVPGATDIVADRIVGKPYVEIRIDRERIARYGVRVEDVQEVIELAIGGENLTWTVEGRERYPVRVRLARDFRGDLAAIGNAPVPTRGGAQVPLSQMAEIETVVGPQEIKGERGLLVGYVTLNTRDRDEVSVVEDAEAALQAAVARGELEVPSGYYWEWSGQFENQVRATERMRILVPLCLAAMFLMLYLGFSRWWVGPIVFFGVLVSAAGGFVMLGVWGANLSVAVWVGFLVLFGVVDDDGVMMSTYLEQRFAGATFVSIDQIRTAVVEAGLKRIRPCLMTSATTIFGLLPVFLADGRGSDVMRPMAIPSVGGMIAQLVTLFSVPVLFCAVEEWRWRRSRSAPRSVQ